MEKMNKNLPEDKLSLSGGALNAVLNFSGEPSAGMPLSHQSSMLWFAVNVARRGIRGRGVHNAHNPKEASKQHLLGESKQSLGFFYGYDWTRTARCQWLMH